MRVNWSTRLLLTASVAVVQTALLRAVALVSVLLAAGAGTGCGRGQQTALAESSAARFPSESLRDWVSYADYVAAYTVVAERDIPPTPEDAAQGAGLVGRDVTLRIDRIVWRAPRAPAMPQVIHMTALGWALVDGRRRALVEDHAPRVAVGEQYVAPVVRVEDDPRHPEWWPLAVGAQLPLAEGRISDSGGWQSALKSQLAAATLDTLGRHVQATAPDPLAVRFSDLRPSERFKAVLRARNQGRPNTSDR
jgi:hypothetical protein